MPCTRRFYPVLRKIRKDHLGTERHFQSERIYSGSDQTVFKFDRILVISNKLQEGMYNLAKSEAEKQSVVKIYNPIDKADTLKKADAIVDDYPFTEDLPTFVTVGTVYPQKGYDRLLNVHKTDR
jgi:glycosyltransferase involved in cell wall biosynthesis